MSVIVTALLLARMDARLGSWCAVADLAAHLAVPETVVRAHLEQLAIEPGLFVAVRFDEWGHVIQAQTAPARLH